ncbi:MAG: DNA double-strand break repair nuclease NurA [Candidatus Bathyarchaeia archaeon]
MIEQYTNTTKYNFPQPTIDTTLPHRFLEQSLYSLKQVRHQHSQLSTQHPQQYSISEQYPSSIQLRTEPILIKADQQETLIAAVDTSTIKIGETSTGIIVAIRGAITWRQNRSYKYTRLGPFIFHVTEDNKNALYNTLEHAYFNTSNGFSHQASPNILQMPTRLASLLERWLQTMLAKTVNHGVILFDGSLISGTIDTPVQRLEEILSYARRNNSTVLAFSKVTTLRANGVLITEQLPNHDPPYLLETTGIHFKPPIKLLGDVYVARLSKANFAFRLDIDKETLVEQQMVALQKLVGNDLYTQSYPETLRLSHILCTFTANEVLAIKHFIIRKYGIQIINRPDMHRLLFGPFGSGEIYA